MNLGLSVFYQFSYGVRAAVGKAALAVFVSWPWAVTAQEPVTLLALGDSLTQGFGLPVQDGFVPQLQGWLDDAGASVVVINAGVSGDTTAGGAARVDWSLTPQVDAMIVALGGNDMLRGLDPDQARVNLSRILEAAQNRGVPVLLVGLEAPSNYGPDYKRAFDAIYPALSDSYDTLYFENFFSGLGQGDLRDLQAFFQADGIHPNAIGVQRIVAKMGPAVLNLVAQAEAD